MEASSTTLNIAGPNVTESQAPVSTETAAASNFTNDRVIHNHKPNFGRYVAGCRKCEQAHPEGPPARKRKAAAAVQSAQGEPAATGLTREQVIALLQEHAPATVSAAFDAPAADTRAQTLEQLVELMMAREKKTLQKDAADEARKESARQDMVRVAKEQEALTANMQTNCGWEYGRPGSHTKENGKTAINGQVHNDGLYHPICFRCFKAFPPIPPRGEQVSRAVSA